MRTKYFVFAAASLAALAGFGAYRAADKDVKDIESIMDAAHSKKEEPNLLQRVLSGKAEKADQQKLLSLYQDLGKNKPPKGSLADWKRRTDALVSAAKEIVDGKPDGITALKKAANCKACHEAHQDE
jgi:hypothetical protein